MEQPIDPTIQLCIKSQDGNRMYYRVKRDLKIKKLLKAYSEDKNIDYGAFRFLYNGQRMNANKTPIELGMEDEDQIDAMVNQTGGGDAFKI